VCEGVPSTDPVCRELTAVLDGAEWMALDVREVAVAFLRADGEVAIGLPDGSFVAVPSGVLRLRPGLVVCLDAEDLERLAEWVLGAGQFAWRQRGPLLTLLGARAPVQLLLAGKASPTLLVRVLGPPGARLSLAASIASFVLDEKNVIEQGNPFWAFRERGSNYVADQQKAWFDLSLGAFAARPHPYTAGAVVLTGTAWWTWAIWDERRRFVERGVRAADTVQDDARNAAREAVDSAADAARSWLDDQVDPGGPDRGPDIPTWVPPAKAAVDGVEKSVDAVDDTLDKAADTVRKTGRKAKKKVDDAVDGVLVAGGKAFDKAADKLSFGN